VFDRELHDIGYNLRRYTQLTYEDIPLSVIRDVFLPAHVRDFGLRWCWWAGGSCFSRMSTLLCCTTHQRK